MKSLEHPPFRRYPLDREAQVSVGPVWRSNPAWAQRMRQWLAAAAA